MRVAMILLGSFLLAGAALGQGMPGGGYGKPGGGMPGPDVGTAMPPPTKRPAGNPADNAQGAAEEQALGGHCDLALPTLRRLAVADGGDIPQYDLGLCLLGSAKSAPSPDGAEAMRKEGVTWVLRAANGGLARAQAEAVTLYLDGTGVDKDPVEAEKWVLLYQHNALRMMFRLPDLDQALQGKVAASLDAAGHTAAEARADAWSQSYWPPRRSE